MKDKIVLISDEGIGHGDEKLGGLLMANFLRMLAERPEVPKALFFLNHGVKLTSYDSLVLAHLVKLTEGGCQLLICRTCLEYLNLLDHMAVGKVSSMGDFIILAEKHEVITV
jgi:hypothetical protein